MDTTPASAPEDDRLDALLGHLRHFIFRQLSFIDSQLARHEGKLLPQPLIRFLRRRWLIPAEAALRRAILIIAAGLEPEPRPASSPEKPLPQRAPSPRIDLPSEEIHRPRRRSARPVFRMSEPQPRPVIPSYLKAAEAARLTILDLTSPALATASTASPVRILPSPSSASDCFRRRLEALSAAYENPLQEARRWLRRHNAHVRQSHENQTPLRPPLSFVRPPGLHPRLGEEMSALLQDANRAAFNALALRRDTS